VSASHRRASSLYLRSLAHTRYHPRVALPTFSTVNDDWQADGEIFLTPGLNPEQDEQLLVFAQTIKDGSVSADLTPISGGKGLAGDPKKDLCLVFRYSGKERCYAAGIGGWGAKYFIARMKPGDWQVLGSSGKNVSLAYGRKYCIRVEFTGSKITLFESVADN
jgi:hypothetical protein